MQRIWVGSLRYGEKGINDGIAYNYVYVLVVAYAAYAPNDNDGSKWADMQLCIKLKLTLNVIKANYG